MEEIERTAKPHLAKEGRVCYHLASLYPPAKPNAIENTQQVAQAIVTCLSLKFAEMARAAWQHPRDSHCQEAFLGTCEEEISRVLAHTGRAGVAQAPELVSR